MSQTSTTNLQLPLLAAAQAQKHVTHNEALLLIDGLAQASVITRGATEPPAEPEDGARYIPASGATGAWADWDLNIAYYLDGVWRKLVPRPGWRVWIADEDRLVAWDGTMWRPAGLPAAPGGAFEPAVPVPAPVAEIWRADSARGPTPRTASIGSISGDMITTASTIDHDFGRWGNLAGNCFIRIWNTDKDPWEPAWIKGGNDADELQVTDAGDISGWSGGETLRIGDPDPSEHADGNDLEMFAIDISPYLEMHFGAAFPAKALIMHVGVGGDSDLGRWQASTDGASGSGIGAVSTDSGNIAYTHILVPTTVPSPISNSHLVFMREQDDMGVVLARLMGVYL